jgi:hypothetical protein
VGAAVDGGGAGAGALVEVVVDCEPAEGVEVVIGDIGAAEADAEGSIAEPEEEPPPHDAHMSAARTAITDLICGTSPMQLPAAQSWPAYSSAHSVPRAWTVDGSAFFENVAV